MKYMNNVCHYSVYMYVHVYIQEHNIVVLVIVCGTNHHIILSLHNREETVPPS